MTGESYFQLHGVKPRVYDICVSRVLQFDGEHSRLDDFHLESVLILAEPLNGRRTPSVPSLELLQLLISCVVELYKSITLLVMVQHGREKHETKTYSAFPSCMAMSCRADSSTNGWILTAVRSDVSQQPASHSKVLSAGSLAKVLTSIFMT